MSDVSERKGASLFKQRNQATPSEQAQARARGELDGKWPGLMEVAVQIAQKLAAPESMAMGFEGRMGGARAERSYEELSPEQQALDRSMQMDEMHARGQAMEAKQILQGSGSLANIVGVLAQPGFMSDLSESHPELGAKAKSELTRLVADAGFCAALDADRDSHGELRGVLRGSLPSLPQFGMPNNARLAQECQEAVAFGLLQPLAEKPAGEAPAGSSLAGFSPEQRASLAAYFKGSGGVSDRMGRLAVELSKERSQRHDQLLDALEGRAANAGERLNIYPTRLYRETDPSFPSESMKPVAYYREQIQKFPDQQMKDSALWVLCPTVERGGPCGALPRTDVIVELLKAGANPDAVPDWTKRQDSYWARRSWREALSDEEAKVDLGQYPEVATALQERDARMGVELFDSSAPDAAPNNVRKPKMGR